MLGRMDGREETCEGVGGGEGCGEEDEGAVAVRAAGGLEKKSTRVGPLP